MNLTVRIPDDLEAEALAAEEYRAGRLTRPDLRRLLGFETGYEIDGFLNVHGVEDGSTPEELTRQLEALDRFAPSVDFRRNG